MSSCGVEDLPIARVYSKAARPAPTRGALDGAYHAADAARPTAARRLLRADSRGLQRRAQRDRLGAHGEHPGHGPELFEAVIPGLTGADCEPGDDRAQREAADHHTYPTVDGHACSDYQPTAYSNAGAAHANSIAGGDGRADRPARSR